MFEILQTIFKRQGATPSPGAPKPKASNIDLLALPIADIYKPKLIEQITQQIIPDMLAKNPSRFQPLITKYPVANFEKEVLENNVVKWVKGFLDPQKNPDLEADIEAAVQAGNIDTLIDKYATAFGSSGIYTGIEQNLPNIFSNWLQTSAKGKQAPVGGTQQTQAVAAVRKGDIYAVSLKIYNKLKAFLDSDADPKLQGLSPEFKKGLMIEWRTTLGFAEEERTQSLVPDEKNETPKNNPKLKEIAEELEKIMSEAGVPTGQQGTPAKEQAKNAVAEALYQKYADELITTAARLVGMPQDPAEQIQEMLKRIDNVKKMADDNSKGVYDSPDVYYTITNGSILFTDAGRNAFLKLWAGNLSSPGATLVYTFIDSVKRYAGSAQEAKLEEHRDTIEGLAGDLDVINRGSKTHKASYGTGQRPDLNTFLVERAMNTGDAAKVTSFDIVVSEGTHQTAVLTSINQLASRGLIYPIVKKDSYNPWSFIINPAFSDIKSFSLDQLQGTFTDFLLLTIGRGEGKISAAIRGVMKAFDPYIFEGIDNIDVKELLAMQSRAYDTITSLLKEAQGNEGAGNVSALTQVLNLVRKFGKEEVEETSPLQIDATRILKKLLVKYRLVTTGPMSVDVEKRYLKAQTNAENAYVILSFKIGNAYFAKLEPAVSLQAETEILSGTGLNRYPYDKLDSTVAEGPDGTQIDTSSYVVGKSSNFTGVTPVTTFQVAVPAKKLKSEKGMGVQPAGEMKAQKTGPPRAMDTKLIDELFADVAAPVQKNRVNYIQKLLKQHLKEYPATTKDEAVDIIRHWTEIFHEEELSRRVDEYAEGESVVGSEGLEFQFNPKAHKAEGMEARQNSATLKLQSNIISAISLIKRKYNLQASSEVSPGLMEAFTVISPKIQEFIAKIRSIGRNPGAAERELSVLHTALNKGDISTAFSTIKNISRILQPFRSAVGDSEVFGIMFEMQGRLSSSDNKDYALIYLQQLEKMLPKVDVLASDRTMAIQAKAGIKKIMTDLDLDMSEKVQKSLSEAEFFQALKNIDMYDTNLGQLNKEIESAGGQRLVDKEDVKKERELAESRLADIEEGEGVHTKRFWTVNYLNEDSAVLEPMAQKFAEAFGPEITDDDTLLAELKQDIKEATEHSDPVVIQTSRPLPSSYKQAPVTKGQSGAPESQYFDEAHRKIKDPDAKDTRMEGTK